MKKIIALLLAVMLVVALCAGCGAKEEEAAASEAAAEAAPAAEAPAEGEASGEPTGEPSGEAPADVPASAAVANEAHGTQSADMAGYKAYLKEWLAFEKSVNTTMDDTMKGEFEALIDAENFTDFPADMLFSGMLTTGAAMTFDEFVAAGGQY